MASHGGPKRKEKLTAQRGTTVYQQNFTVGSDKQNERTVDASGVASSVKDLGATEAERKRNDFLRLEHVTPEALTAAGVGTLEEKAALLREWVAQGGSKKDRERRVNAAAKALHGDAEKKMRGIREDIFYVLVAHDPKEVGIEFTSENQSTAADFIEKRHMEYERAIEEQLAKADQCEKRAEPIRKRLASPSFLFGSTGAVVAAGGTAAALGVTGAVFVVPAIAAGVAAASMYYVYNIVKQMWHKGKARKVREQRDKFTPSQGVAAMLRSALKP